MTHAGQSHWDAVYEKKAATEVSWYEPHPDNSLELIRSTGVHASDPLIDVGGGASLLVDELLADELPCSSMSCSPPATAI